MLYFTRQDFIEACQATDRTGRNRRIAWENLPKNQEFFPVLFHMVHNDIEMRVHVICDLRMYLTEDKRSGSCAYLDMSFMDWENVKETPRKLSGELPIHEKDLTRVKATR